MYTSIDRHLAQTRYQEALQEAAEARANRRAPLGRPRRATARLIVALAASAGAVIWLFSLLAAG